MKPIRLPAPLTCQRCKNIWIPRQEVVTMCPRCKSKHWQTKRTDRRGLRPKTKRGKKS